MEEKVKVLYLVPLQEADRRVVAESLPFAEITFVHLWKFTAEQAAEAEVVFGNIPTERLGEFKKLKWIHLFSAGVDLHLDIAQLKGVMLTNSSGVFDEVISEYLLAGSFLHMLHFPVLMRFQSQHLWKDGGKAIMMNGATVLVAGVGNIGSTFARKAKLLGAERIIGIRRNISIKPDYIDEMYTLADLPEQLPRADIVASVLPGSDETRKIYNKDTFARFKKGAIFVNAGRGISVDMDALIEAVESGALAGATIDVTDPEPLPPDHRAWDVENLVITAHVAGGFKLSHTLPMESCFTLRQMVGTFGENLRRYHKGEPLKNVILQG